MGWKILDENDEIVFEFKDHDPAAHWLTTIILKSKFGEKYDSMMMTPNGDHWLFQLLKACNERANSEFNKSKEQQAAQISKMLGRKTTSFLDLHIAKMSEKDEFGYTELDNTSEIFFHEIEKFLVRKSKHYNWANLNPSERRSCIRHCLYPHEISDARIKDMIEDIDSQLQEYSEAYNPDYKENL